METNRTEHSRAREATLEFLFGAGTMEQVAEAAHQDFLDDFFGGAPLVEPATMSENDETVVVVEDAGTWVVLTDGLLDMTYKTAGRAFAYALRLLEEQSGNPDAFPVRSTGCAAKPRRLRDLPFRSDGLYS